MCYGFIVSSFKYVCFILKQKSVTNVLLLRLQLFCLIVTLFRWHLITEHKHLSPDPQLSSVTRNCQIYSMQLDTLITVIFLNKIIPEFYHS